MLQLIKCSTCKKDGSFPIEHKLRISTECCEKCHHINEVIWTYYFCSPGCFNIWLTEIATKGITCHDCRGTGFTAGFTSNGTCSRCNGTGSIRKLG
jgi:hypothetical protein